MCAETEVEKLLSSASLIANALKLYFASVRPQYETELADNRTIKTTKFVSIRTISKCLKKVLYIDIKVHRSKFADQALLRIIKLIELSW